MIRKIINYTISIFALIIVIGVVFNYYIFKPKEPEELICYKGKLLVRIEEGASVYSRIKSVSCEYEKGMLIMEGYDE